MCIVYIYTLQYLKENFTVIRCIIFYLRTDIGKRTITFFATKRGEGSVFDLKLLDDRSRGLSDDHVEIR